MKLLFVTDIHGVKWKYERIFQIAKSLKPDLVLNGGDMLPFKGNLLKQGRFIDDFLDDYLSKFESEKIYYLFIPGNDDLIIFDELFNEMCDKYRYIANIAQNKFQIEYSDYEFIGMNWVTDLPFGLKDRARKDAKDFTFPKQIGNQVLSTPNGWKEIDDWFSFVDTLPTIEEELNNLIRPIKIKNTIYLIHMPPSKLGLDVCYDGRKVGSKAIYDYLQKNQPLLSLHGHIHESLDVSGIWHSNIGETVCIQPGQAHFYENYLIYITIDLKNMEIKRFKVNKRD